MRATRLATLALLAGAIALAGCDKARTVPPDAEASTSCTGCHGGGDNATGAPPRDTKGNTGAAALGVGAHTRHVDAGLGCEECHVKPARLRDPGHISGLSEIVFGNVARQPNATVTPAYDRATGTCSNVYCHGARLPAGDRGLATAPRWNVAPLAGAPCASCHGTVANAGGPPLPHPQGQTRSSCATCHPDSVDTAGEVIGVAAGGKHLNGAPDIADLACTACHGDRAGDRTSDAGSPAAYAPPLDVAGSTTGPRVGAHLRHVSRQAGLGSRISQPFACTECHAVPRASGPHVVPPATVVQFGTAAAPAPNVSTAGGLTPVYNATSGSCATTWCHGAGLGAGGAIPTPTWSGAGAGACGACHFQGSNVNAAPNHPQVDAVVGGVPITANTQCYKCHAGTVNPDGTVIIGLGNHVNGTVEFTSPHPLGWVTSTVHGPVAKRDLALCQGCHGANFDTVVLTVGGNGKSCNSCHANPALFIAGYTGQVHPAWKTECTFCHGDANRAAVAGLDSAGAPLVNSGKVAPPHGSQDEVDALTNAVGAHLRHVSDDAAAGNRYAAPFQCSQCHGAGVLGDAAHQGVGHADALVNIGWQLAATGTTPVLTGPTVTAGAIPAARGKTGTPRGTSVSCANYCHGATLGGGTAKTVTWNVSGSVSGCDACHGFPPPYAAPGWHAAGSGAAACGSCHYAGVNRALHVNGTLNLSAAVGCTSCHGGAANAAPPGAASAPATTSADPRVGAHQAHVTGTRLRQTGMACAACHGTPPTTMTHADGVVTIGWTTLASAGSVTPSPVAGTRAPASTSTCSNYCHGGRWAPPAPATNADYRGSITSPSWTGGPSQAACGACHQVPPASAAHAAVTNCATCHAGYTCATPGNLASCTTVNLVTHVNGALDADLTCFSCHGTQGVNVAPPKATAGSTATSNPKVGAHQAHLTGVSLRAAVLACTDCHTVPGSTGHTDATIQLTWGALATTGGVTPAPSSLSGAALVAWESTPTCTNYCHGGKWAGNAAYQGATTQPSWTSTGVATQCNDCHLAPPTSSNHAGVTASTNCSTCHAGYNCTSGSLATCTVNPATHLDGVFQAPSMACSGCHGSAGRTAMVAGTFGPAASANQLLAMPPRDSAGATASVRTGAHPSHSVPPTPSAQVYRSIPCQECHGTAVNSYTNSNHANGNPNLTFANATVANLGGVTPAVTQNAPPAADTCTTYCHGASLTAQQRGSVTLWQWTSTAAADCGSCHGAAPNDPAHTTVSKTAQATPGVCNACHATVVSAAGAIVFNGTGTSATTLHINGTRQSTATCTSCHGGTNAAPPRATSGSSAVTNPKVGAHQTHVTGTRLRGNGMACVACHPNNTSVAHASATVDLAWSTLAALGVTPAPATITAGWESTPTCTNYCHGGKWIGNAAYQGATTSPTWTSTGVATQCNDCHLAPPTSSGHSTVTATTNCQTCHTGYNCTSANLAACTVNPASHINGSLQVNASCTGCHASAVTGTVNRRAITPEFGYAWSHKRSATPAGTVTNGDCGVCHMEGDVSGNQDGNWHGNGLVNLRDPDTGTHIKQVTFTNTGATTGNAAGYGYYAQGAANATFATFSRNLSSNVLEATVQAIMVNQCLKCHDANGAQSTAARVPGAPAEKPFNTTIGLTTNYRGVGVVAGNVAGGVTDVNASFATSNSSYHPVRGRNNNSFAQGTRMVAPWNITKTTGNSTSWGHVISCWDCHALPEHTGTITMTVTAHGGTATLRGNAVHATGGSAPVATGAVTLCNKCHQYYNTCGTAADQCASTTSHGSGSAFSSNPGRSTKSPYLRYACNKCHASTYTTAVVRPVRAMDNHGTNVLPAAGTKTSRWSTDPRPFAFIRNTQMFSSHQPARIGATSYTPNCVHLNDGDCTSRTETYTAGGTY